MKNARINTAIIIGEYIVTLIGLIMYIMWLVFM